MPRTARKQSETGIYHVMLRGINQQTIFNDNEDFEKFIDVIKDCKAVSEFELYAYCLMDNHIHILLKEKKEKLSQIFKRIGVRYVYWYNQKYSRQGHLFYDRYKSEPVNDNEYFITVLRYIHQNPIKSSLVKKIEQYKYSSYNDYIKSSSTSFIDTYFILDLLKDKDFVEFHKQSNKDVCLDINLENIKLTDAKAKSIIEKISGCENIEQFLKLNNENKEKYIKMFKEEGISYRQISRLTGVSFGIVRKI